MKITVSVPSRPWLLFILCALLGAVSLNARAQNGVDTWNSAGTTAIWGGTGSSANWTGANTPPITGDGLIFDVDNSAGSALGDVLTDNLTVGGTNSWTFTNITFTANAPGYTFKPGTAGGQGPGTGFTLGTTTPATVIAQNSGSSETILETINLAAANQSIALNGGGNLTLQGLVTGLGGLTLNDPGNGAILILTNSAPDLYTGATVVNGGTLDLYFINTGTSGIYKSSGLTINNGGTVGATDNALAGSTSAIGSLPVTVNAGGILTGISTADGGAGGSSHLRGVLTLNGGTLANAGSGNEPAYGSWDLDDGVVVGAGSGQPSVISALDVVPDQTSGTIFNVGVSGSNPDLDVQGTLIHGTSQADTGIIKQGAGVMQLDAVNTYTGATTISAGTLTITSSGLLGGATGQYAGLITNNGTLNYNNSAAETFSGIIRGTGVINVNAGTLTLSGANTYTGATTVASGANLTVASGGSSASSPLTMAGSTTFTENVTTAGGQWTGTNLVFQDSSPALVINFSAPPSTTIAPLKINGNVNFASTLTLTLNGSQLIPTGTYPLITWTGTASGTSPTTANANVTINLAGIVATVVQSGSSINLVVSSGTGPVSWNTGSGTWDTTSANWLGSPTYKNGDAVTFPDTTGSSPITVTLNSTVTPTSVVFTNNVKNYILTGSGGIAGPAGLTQNGTGSLTLSTANTYTGSTVVNDGSLTLDFTQPAAPASGIISASSALSLGNVTLNVLGSATTPSSQTFASTAFTSGNATINFGNNNNPSLTLGGAITAAKGATVVIPATGGSVFATTAGGASGGVLGTGVGANDTAGFATFGSSDWAATTGGEVTNLTSLGGYVTTMGGTGQGQNMDVQANYTAGGNSGTTTLRYNTCSATNVNINGKWLVINAILVTPNMGPTNCYIWSGNNATAGGAYYGNYSSANAQQVYVWQNNPLAYFVDNGSLANGKGSGPTTAITTYIQAGPGTVVRGPNTYSGPYSGTNFLNGGFTVITTDNGLGVPATAAGVLLGGGTLFGNATLLTLDNAGVNPRPIGLLNAGGGLAAAAGDKFTIDGIITGGIGSGPLVIGIPASSANGNVAGLLPGSGPGTANLTPVYGTGTVALTAANSYTGGTVLDSGVLNITAGSLGTGGVTFNGGTLQWSTTSPDISTQTVTVTANGGTLDVNGQSVTLANSIGNGGAGALTITNSGAPGLGGLSLNGGNSYTGGTTVASGAVFGGAGTITGNVTWNSGSYAALSSSSPLTVAGAVTLNSPTVKVTGSSLTTGVYTLLTATSITGGSTVNSTPSGTGVIATGYAGTVSISGNSVILTVTQSGVTETWTDAGGDQNWSTVNNWSGSFVPHRPGDVATFGTGGVGLPVNLNQSETVGGVAFANASSYVITGANTLTLDASGHGAAIGVTAGTTNDISTAVALNDNLTVSVNGGDSLTLAGGIANVSGAKALTVNGGGTLVLGAANSYGPSAGTVGTTLGGATVVAGNSSALGAGDVSVTASSTLQAVGTGVALANNISVANANTLSLGGNGTNLVLGGVISGNGALAKNGTGNTTLSGANNTYAAGTVLNNGILGIVADGAAAGNPGSLGVVPAAPTANNILLTGGDLLGTATLTLNANRLIGIGSSSIASAAVTTGLIDAAAGQTLTVAGTIGTAGNVGVNNLTVNSEAGSSGTVVLAGANTFNGTNVIAGGTEQLGNALALQDTTLFYNNQGGSLSFGALTAATLGSLSGSQNLTLTNAAAGAVALTVGNNDTTNVYTGLLTGSGSLNLAGTTLNATETIGFGASGGASYTGATTVTFGSLTLGGIGNSVETGTIDINGGYGENCNLTVTDSAGLSTTGPIYLCDAGGANYPGPCTLTVSGNANVSGASLSIGNGTRVPTGCGVTVAGHGTLTVAGSFDVYHSEGGTSGSSVISLNGGTLAAGSFIEGGLSSGTHPITVNFNGGLLDATTNDPDGGEYLPLLASVTINVTNALVPAYISSSNYWITIGGVLSGGGDAGVVKSGAGTLVLSGANTYTGPTVVSNGTLLVSGALNNSAENFTVNDGQAFGAYFDGSDTPQIGTLTLGQSSGATLVFTNLSSTTAAAFHADYLDLNGHGTVKIDDAINLTAGNEYPLIELGGGIVTNSGNGLSLVLPPGVTATLTNDFSIIPGFETLALKVTSIVPYTPPVVIGSPVISGNNLVLSATGGNPGDPVTVLTTTNLALPLAQWTTVTTGNYDGNGNFSYTVSGAISSGLPQQFYILQGQ